MSSGDARSEEGMSMVRAVIPRFRGRGTDSESKADILAGWWSLWRCEGIVIIKSWLIGG